MAKGVLGFEIGNYRMKIASCTESAITQFCSVEIPENLVREGQIVSWESMAEFIKETMKKNQIKGKNVAMVLPDNSTYVRTITLPMMTASQLKVNLPYEFRDFINEDKDKYFYDYAVIPDEEESEAEVAENTENNADKDKTEVIDQKLNLLAAAIRKDTIEKYRTMFRRCGLKLQVATPEVMAFQNLLLRYARKHGVSTHKDVLILDLGNDSVRLHIFTNGYYEATRNMDIGLREMTSIIARKLDCDEHIAEIHKQNNEDNIWDSEECRDLYGDISVAIMRVVNFFTFNHPNNTLESIYYCGGGAMITPLIEEIDNTIELKMKGLELLFDDMKIQREQVLEGPAAIGINWN